MIDDVYRVVQIIANKNNYGVITPERFNDLARNAQLKIINELPEDLRRAKNRHNTIRSANRGFSDHIRQLQNVIDIFVRRQTLSRDSVDDNNFTLPTDLHYIESIWFKDNIEVEEIDKKNSGYVRKNSLGIVSEEYPHYERLGNIVTIYPNTVGVTGGNIDNNVSILYHRLPVDPKWTFTTVLSRPVFNIGDATYQDFELPGYLMDRLVIDIAGLVGIHLREQQVAQYVQQEQNDNFQRKIIN